MKKFPSPTKLWKSHYEPFPHQEWWDLQKASKPLKSEGSNYENTKCLETPQNSLGLCMINLDSILRKWVGSLKYNLKIVWYKIILS